MPYTNTQHPTNQASFSPIARLTNFTPNPFGKCGKGFLPLTLFSNTVPSLTSDVKSYSLTNLLATANISILANCMPMQILWPAEKVARRKGERDGMEVEVVPMSEELTASADDVDGVGDWWSHLSGLNLCGSA